MYTKASMHRDIQFFQNQDTAPFAQTIRSMNFSQIAIKIILEIHEIS